MANEVLKRRLDILKKSGFFDKLVIKRGIEKEFFRVNEKGYISNRPHPKTLGSALTNKYITTDFAEAQLELVTPEFEDIDDLYNFLYSIHSFVAKNIDSDEMLWPFSMPPKIRDESEINLGYYHQSNIGLLKHVYRRGLKVRYGPTMQCVSGMHYNFSIKPESLAILNKSNTQEDADNTYLGIIRNFKRLFWFVLLEFGETNVVDKSFVTNRPHNLEELNSQDMYLKYATSLRMSEIGYQSKAQKSLNIKYNSLSNFLKKIKGAITDPFSEFEHKGLFDRHKELHQISNGIIQIENEYYDSIRPKRSAHKDVRPYELLKNYGIEYLEIRGIDISPHDITGISVQQIKFIDLLLIYCLIMQSPRISNDEKKSIDFNDSKVIYGGRNPDTKININGKYIDIESARKNIYEDLKLIAMFYENTAELQDALEWVSSRKKGEIPKKGFHQSGIENAKKNTEILRGDMSKDLNGIKKEAALSLKKLNNISTNTKEEMNEFVKSYNSKL